MPDISGQIDALYERRGELLLEQFAIKADLRRVESVSARRALEMRCSEIENDIKIIDAYVDRIVLLRAVTPAPRPVPATPVAPKPARIALKPVVKPPKPKISKPKRQAKAVVPEPVVAKDTPLQGPRKWTHSLPADTHLPVNVVSMSSVKAGVSPALCDEINRRSSAMLRWAPWARRRHYSRRYEGFR